MYNTGILYRIVHATNYYRTVHLVLQHYRVLTTSFEFFLMITFEGDC
jgi:hypothetical protein